MTTAIAPTGEVDAASRPPWRSWWLLAMLSLLLLAIVGAGIGWIVYRHTYRPLSDTVVGTFDPLSHLQPVGDYSGPGDEVILVGPPGTTGIAEYDFGNTGHHSVVVQGIGAMPKDTVISAEWASSVNPGNGAVLGLRRDAHPFPVTLHGNQWIFVQISVTNRGCGRLSNTFVDHLDFRWSAYGLHHIWSMPLDGGTNPPINLCPSTHELTEARQEAR